MVNQKYKSAGKLKSGLFIVTVLFLMMEYLSDFAQELPPRPVSVYYTQSLSFGALSLGTSGGSITVYPSGIRSSTGGVIPVGMGYPFYPAIFNLSGNPGTVIHPLLGLDAVLTGSNGGSLTLHLENIDPGDPIILNTTYPGQMPVKVGGTLYIGIFSANPPGVYSGTFSIMFIQE